MTKPKYDDETLYAAWVAHDRNGNEAAKALGMQPQAFRWHVREKGFEKRFLEESAGGSHLAGRLAILQTFGRLPEVYERLFKIGLGQVTQDRLDRDGNAVKIGPSFRDQVAALAAILKHVPSETVAAILGEPLPGIRPASLTLIDARQIVAGATTPLSLSESTEEESKVPAPLTINEDTYDAEAEAVRILESRMLQ
jgi:hypothetical protein